MNAIDLSPDPCFRPAIVREIDFDPTNGALDLFRIPGDCAHRLPRIGVTSNAPNQSIRLIESISSPWRMSTSANSHDRILEIVHSKVQRAHSVPEQLAEIKRITGYGWERIATLLGRTRQAIHRWSLGETITDENRDRLSRLHALMLYIDRGNAEANQTVLSMAHQGLTLADCLADGRFDDVRSVAGKGAGRAKWGRVENLVNHADDHWYDQILTASDFDDSSIRARPQETKRLRMRKG